MYNISGIYKITNLINGKFYIGSSGNVGHRWKCVHIHRLRNNKHFNVHLQNAWNKYGEPNFKIEILKKCPPAKLLIVEQRYLDACVGLKKCYNIAKTASAPNRGLKFSNKTRKLMSLQRKGKNNPFFGKQHTNETKLKIRAARAKQINIQSKKLTNEQIIEIKNSSHTQRELASKYGVSQCTIWKYLKLE